MRSEWLVIAIVAAAGCSGSSSHDVDGGDGAMGTRDGGGDAMGTLDGGGGALGTPDGGAGTLGNGANQDGGAPAAAVSGAPVAVQLGTLNPEQRNQVCQWTVAKSNAEAPTRCLPDALVAALKQDLKTNSALRTSCNEAYKECLDARPEAVVCSTPPATCTATVGEWETCFNDHATALAAFVGQLPTCDTITLDYEPDAKLTPLQAPASCETYASKCEDYVPGAPSSPSAL